MDYSSCQCKILCKDKARFTKLSRQLSRMDLAFLSVMTNSLRQSYQGIKAKKPYLDTSLLPDTVPALTVLACSV